MAKPSLPQSGPYAQAAGKLTSEIVEVSPDYARTLRESCHFERQRNINEDQVRRLASEMREGWFLAGTPVWLCILPDKSMVIVNGNHTLEAVASLSFSVPLTFVYQRVKDMDEAANAYACFDINKTRSWGDAARAVAIDKKLPMAGAVLSALGMIITNFANTGHRWDLTGSRQRRFDLAKEYEVASYLLSTALHGAPKANVKYVLRGPVMAVALVTARYQPSSAEEFWRGLAMDDALKMGDPRKTLLRYLAENNVQGAISRHTTMRATASAWNAFFEHRSVGFLKPNADTKFRILGTPWSGKAPEQSPPSVRKPSAIQTGRRLRADGTSEAVAIHAG